MTHIDEKLDRITDYFFGVSEYPGYYKDYPKYFFPDNEQFVIDIH